MLQTRLTRLRRIAVLGVVGALAVALSACAQSDRDQGGDGATGGTFVFGAAADPKNFDPIFNDEGETDRIIRQMYDSLVAYEPGSVKVAPGLAESWNNSQDGKDWTFNLRKGVKFHDGTPFNAQAVCFNYDRWYNMRGAPAQNQMLYYSDVFGGYANDDRETTGEPIYKSCEAKDENTAIIHLNKPRGAFPAAFGLTFFGISSPDALRKYDADKVTQNGDSFEYSAYANEHPTGTGAFKFESYNRDAKTVTLVRNDDYWGTKPKLDKIVIKTISDENARKAELRAGTIDGYDQPPPQDYQQLKNDGFNVMVRPPFNMLYLGINQAGNPALKDIRVRQALAYAVNRDQLVKTRLPEGASVAKEFSPDSVSGYAKDVQEYPYDPQKARDLLAAAGVSNLTLKFYRPTDTRPYLPNPEEIAGSIANDLKQAGINTEIIAKPFNGGFKDDVQQLGKHDIHLLGWNGDYDDMYNWIGTFFGRTKPEFGFTEPALFNGIAAADATVDPAGKAQAYEQVNRDIMSKYLPAVPLYHSPPGIVVAQNIKGMVPSPLNNERFNTVSKE